MIETFLATVDVVYPTNKEFDPYEKVSGSIDDTVSVYNGNKTKDFGDLDASLYGTITYRFEDSSAKNEFAKPFDRNNFTFPIKGETVVILKMFGTNSQTFWLPYTNTPYPNYRKDYTTDKNTKPDNSSDVGNGTDRKKADAAGGLTNSPREKTDDVGYEINEKIKFLKPKNGDTILSGRVGNTIRLSEFFLSSDNKSYPGIYIRNKQNPENDNKKIGETVDEDINKDGTSVYFVSGKTKVPFKETISKTKIAFKEYPSDFSGDQLFINSDRIIISSKANEFIIYGKGNTGVITDGNYSIDAGKDVYINSDKNIIIHSNKANQIFLNSENGKIYLGKNQGEGDAGADVQKMVLGGELVAIMKELINAINNQIFATSNGPTDKGPSNSFEFQIIEAKLNRMLSSTNFLSK
jgi:hypothetical protein